MTKSPPIPDASVSPYPATPAPHDHLPPAKAPEETRGARGVDKRIVAGVAGIAVGSAAIAAALLFAGRLSKPKTAALPDPSKPPARNRASANEIGVD